MKIAVSSQGSDLNSLINPRFGRCEYFIIVDTDDLSAQAFANENINASTGAGIQAASLVINNGARAVITGSCGPKAMDVFNSAGIPVYTGQSGTVSQAVAGFNEGGWTASSQATAPEKAGMIPSGGQPGSRPPQGQQNTGRGMGCGGGRGMGGSRGCGGRGMGGGMGGCRRR